MKLSIAVTNYSWDEGPDQLASHLRDLAQQADDAGIDTLWVADHLLQMDPTAAIDEPMLEAYTTLGFLAAATRRIQLGTMVTWATIRPPSLLVKMVTTLDVLSNGRAWLGLGDLTRTGIDHLVLVTNGPWSAGGDLDVVLEAVEPLRAVA